MVAPPGILPNSSGGFLSPGLLQYLSQTLGGIGQGLLAGPNWGQGLGMGIQQANQNVALGKQQSREDEAAAFEREKMKAEQEKAVQAAQAEAQKQQDIDAYIAAAPPERQPQLRAAASVGALDSVIAQQMKPENPDPFDMFVKEYRSTHEGQNPPLSAINEFRQAGSRPPVTNVNVTADFGKTPEGWVRIPDPNAVGGYRYERATGGEPEEKKAASAAQRVQTADVVTTDIDRAIKLVDSATLPTTGLVGSQLQNVPGTAAHDIQQLVAGVRANVSFDTLQKMRAASPTGGALGPVSDLENKKLESALGSLEQSQTKEQFVTNLRRVKQIYLEIVHGPTGGYASAAPTETPKADVQWIWKDGQLVPAP